MSDRRTPPPSLRSLEQRIHNLARERGVPVRRVQRAIANTVVAQMLPPGAVKGGAAMAIRAGAASRFTTDLDAAHPATTTLEAYLRELQANLSAGWGGFAGQLVRKEPATPDGVPAAYVMQPFDIGLAYEGRHWLTVRFELGRDEIGGTTHPERVIARDLRHDFALLGLQTPNAIGVLPPVHQIAQKLHACTGGGPGGNGNQRAHDLVDLQLLVATCVVDLPNLREVALRLFTARREQPWPPTVRAYPGWDRLYVEAAVDLAVIADVAGAVSWANAFIGEVETAAR